MSKLKMAGMILLGVLLLAVILFGGWLVFFSFDAAADAIRATETMKVEYGYCVGTHLLFGTVGIAVGLSAIVSAVAGIAKIIG